MVSINYTEYSDEFDEAVEAGRKRRFWRRFTIFVVLLAIVGSAAAVVRFRYFAPVDVENATPDKAVGWLVLKDLSQESEENQEKLFDMYVGSVSVPDVQSKTGVAFELPAPVAKFSGLILAGREAGLKAWKSTHKRESYLRIDYVVRPADPRESVYVTTRDVAPGPDLLQRWNERQEALKSGALPKRKAVEKNVQLILMRWFLAKSKSYDAAPDAKKRAYLEATADEMQKFQNLYNKLVEDAGQPIPTRVETLQEFEMTVDGWLELAQPDQLAKALWFKDLLVTIAAGQIGGLPQSESAYPPRLPDAQASEKDAAKEEKTDEIKRKANDLLEKIKGSVFTTK